MGGSLASSCSLPPYPPKLSRKLRSQGEVEPAGRWQWEDPRTSLQRWGRQPSPSSATFPVPPRSLSACPSVCLCLPVPGRRRQELPRPTCPLRALRLWATLAEPSRVPWRPRPRFPGWGGGGLSPPPLPRPEVATDAPAASEMGWLQKHPCVSVSPGAGTGCQCYLFILIMSRRTFPVVSSQEGYTVGAVSCFVWGCRFKGVCVCKSLYCGATLNEKAMRFQSLVLTS